MKQEALCITDCWDGPKAMFYERGRTYKIDPDAHFAKYFRMVEPEEEEEEPIEGKRGPGRPKKD